MPTLPRHITIEGDGVRMTGYTVNGFKDFLLMKNEFTSFRGYNRVQLSFDIKSENNTWHSMEGGGFLFNASINSDGLLKGYCVLVTQQGLRLYYINNVNAQDFSDGKLGSGRIANMGQLLETYDIGNVLSNHKITLRVIGEELTLWNNNIVIIDKFKLPHQTFSHDFGPITSHNSHACNQISHFVFQTFE